MALVGLAVLAVWAVMLGAAWLARGVLGMPRGRVVALLVACYLVLASAAVVAITPLESGLLGAAGMLVPLTVATALVSRR